MTVRSAVGILERQGWLVRRQGLGTFVADPVRQELGSGVRTITEVLLSSGVTREWRCCPKASARHRNP
ncbi:bacterial regulatory s, gntR family protein [Mycobacterium kansasii]|uniref:Bacterial regulatory s, gntR family protein n=1 Tax=Mycobacterium kansasii TaxID=1768 RepID=A0A1V3WV59_MYCKA|nr:bacterial regulatory s, gntR family protein [Mycobacterium kansasii]